MSSSGDDRAALAAESTNLEARLAKVGTSTRLPPREETVLPLILERQAEERGDSTVAIFEDESEWTYAQAVAEMSDAANALAALGVQQGDRVVAWMPNGPELVRTWFGLNQLGAVFVPLNTAFRGSVLEHTINASEASLAIVHHALAERLEPLDMPNVERVVVVGGKDSSTALAPGVDILDETVLRSGISIPIRPARPVEPWDPQSVIYTSGTTGNSKGVLSSYFHLYNTAATVVALQDVGPDDRMMMHFPLFHVGGTVPTTSMILQGGSVVVAEGFQTKRFWAFVRSTGSTHTWLGAVMAAFLLKEPERPDDRAHPLRNVAIVPNSDPAQRFVRRFGVRGVTMFNQTEANMPIVSVIDPDWPRLTGRLRPGVEARIVDENDNEVEFGRDGELVLRTTLPWALNSGYLGHSEVTARAWRNGWWHTGDRFRRDEQGNYYCIDRMNDCIQRRGENISPTEVEAELLAYPAVRQAAAVAVPSELDTNDVLAVVAPVPGETIDPAALLEFLVPRMAYYTVPRYIRVVDELPMTNGRVVRRVLRDEGVTPDTWDRDTAGINVKRDRLQ